MNRAELLTILQCDRCAGPLSENEADELVCRFCQHKVRIQQGTPIFTSPPENLQPSAKLARGPETGTPWRRANWRFLQEQAARLDPAGFVLDVGAGRGDFSALFEHHPNYVALDIYPYPEVDLVCDLTRSNPFQPGSFDLILLLNVLEHVYPARELLNRLAGLLKPGGSLVVAVPFLVKLHQIPLDYARYTHYALHQMGADCGLEVSRLEGYYDPVFFLSEGIGNLKHAVLPGRRGMAHYAGRLVVAGIHFLAQILDRILGPGRPQAPDTQRSLTPTGYHVVYSRRK